MKRDWVPLALLAVLVFGALPLVASLPIWITLTAAGLAMGMMIFMMASGLTLVFGLMDVMNFAHGVFISVGAYAAASVLLALKGQAQAPGLAANLLAIGPAVPYVSSSARWNARLAAPLVERMVPSISNRTSRRMPASRSQGDVTARSMAVSSA